MPATPASTTGLSSEIQDILDTQPGARYLLADLQVHTPLDRAFEPKWDPREGGTRELFARSYLSKAKERGIELVGITEHNDVSWIDDLRQAARDLGLHLLPGFEVESKEGIHVLCLFDPDRPAHDLDEVLTELGLTRAKRQERRLELRSSQAFDELVAFIQEDCGGVCIAAHVESDKGLLKALRAGARGVNPAAMRVGVSVRRNQMIVQRLVELGLVDAVGRGIVLLVEEAARLGLPEPAIDVPPGFTRVALHLAPEL